MGGAELMCEMIGNLEMHAGRHARMQVLFLGCGHGATAGSCGVLLRQYLH
jgi:spermidine synthase